MPLRKEMEKNGKKIEKIEKWKKSGKVRIGRKKGTVKGNGGEYYIKRERERERERERAKTVPTGGRRSINLLCGKSKTISIIITSPEYFWQA
jgi:hypothetical protein